MSISEGVFQLSDDETGEDHEEVRRGLIKTESKIYISIYVYIYMYISYFF